MANFFTISEANSFDWFLLNPVINPSYNSLPPEYNRLSYNPNGVYHQKFQTDDTPPTQLFSDFTPTFKWYKCGTNQFYKDEPLTIVANSIIGVSWKVYQCTTDFSIFAVGSYYGQITYIDENDNVITYRTSPIDIKVTHYNTIRFEYKNTYNALNLLFQPSGLELQFRVEGVIAYLDPESEDQLYTDQNHTVLEEDSIPYDLYTLYIGDAEGVPEWVIKKVRYIFTMSNKLIDGLYYEKAEANSKFSPTRTQENTPNSDAYWSIPVIRNEDFFLDNYTAGDNTPDNEIQVIVRSKKYLLNGGDIAMANILNDGYFLAFIQITNRELTSFNVLVGTTPGGMELGVYPLSGDIVDTLIIGKGFRVATTLYITGLAGNDTDVRIEYHYLDDVSQIPTGVTGLPKNSMIMYHEGTPGDFENDFNPATGLGIGKFVGWAIMDGRNGTTDMSHMVPVGWDITLPATRDTSVGSPDNLLIQQESQVGRHRHSAANSNSQDGYGKFTTGDRPQEGDSLLTDYNIPGDPEPMDITNFSIYTVFILKIVD